MKPKTIFLLGSIMLMSACSTQQYNATIAGSSVGGMLGGSLGGIIGGPRGHDTGTLIGLVAGGAVGAAVTSQSSSETTEPRQTPHIALKKKPKDYKGEDAPYREDSYSYIAPSLSQLMPKNFRFTDENHNGRLEAGERAQIEIDIYNTGSSTICNLVPVIRCSNKRINVSSPVSIPQLAPGQGFRYKAELVGTRKLKEGRSTLTVVITSGNAQMLLNSYDIITGH